MVELQRLVGAHLGFDCRTLLGISLRGIKEREILSCHSVRWARVGAGGWSGVREKYYWLAGGWKLVLERCERKILLG